METTGHRHHFRVSIIDICEPSCARGPGPIHRIWTPFSFMFRRDPSAFMVVNLPTRSRSRALAYEIVMKSRVQSLYNLWTRKHFSS